MIFLFPQVGYVNSLEGNHIIVIIDLFILFAYIPVVIPVVIVFIVVLGRPSNFIPWPEPNGYGSWLLMDVLPWYLAIFLFKLHHERRP